MRATLENVTDTLASKASGVELRLDDFTGSILISGSDRSGRPLDDDDLGVLRAEFGRRGFKPISPEVMKTSVRMVAKANRFDAARDWADSLKWDGVQRIDMALATHFGATATAYVQGVGRYLFSALAGRALVPGIRADMALVLIGMQGARKTSAVAALSPDPRFFTEINLARIDHDDTARRLRGKLVGELSELRGLRGRDQESVKAWITRRIEAWTPKYMEFEATYPRRLILIGTTNEREFLDDVTGERRWLPVEVGAVDVDALERDRDQLWAEGVARFKASGIAWQDAERLARGEHARFKVTDAWEDLVSTWLAGSVVPGGLPRSTAPFKLQDVAVGALNRGVQSLQRADELRLAKVLRSLGYEKKDTRMDGRVVKAWMPRAVALVAHQ
jgi:predicted P-loop ATPase